MRKYMLMKSDYITSCIFQTNDLMEMKNKIIRILGDLYKSYDYALSGINNLRIDDLYFEGCWVDVWQDGKLIQSVDITKGDELR